MAEINPLDPNAAQLMDLSQQRKLADLLTQQGLQSPQGQMVSGQYVKSSPLQYFANMANLYAGQKTGEQATQKALDYAKALQAEKSAKEKTITNLITGTPGQEGGIYGPNGQITKETTADMYGADMQLNPQYKQVAAVAAQKPDYAAALREIGTNNPYNVGQEYKATILGNMIPKTPDSVAKYKFAQTPEGGNYKGSLADFENQMNDYQRADLAIKRQAQLNQGNGANLTEFQGKATNFGIQMAGSIGEMAAVEKSGFNPATSKNQALLSVSGTTLGNYLVPPEVQRYKQGMDNFTESYIRFKSGANVPMHEIEKDLKNMMPQPGDLPDKLEQKQRARERALQGMAISAGPGARFILDAYKIEAPGMKNEKPAAPAANAKATPSLWGKATVVQEGN
jgi:hypothetical protein